MSQLWGIPTLRGQGSEEQRGQEEQLVILEIKSRKCSMLKDKGIKCFKED